MPRTSVFVSYSHSDQIWQEKLVTHLAVLERQNLIHVWADTRLQIGERWEKQIDDALAACQVAVLLVTPNFLASEYIQSVEVQTLLERHAAGGLAILPVIVRPCAWRLVDFLASRQCRPEGGRALSTGTESEIDQDLALLTYELATLIGQAVGADVVKEMGRLSTRPSSGRQSSGRDGLSPASAAELVGTSWEGDYGPVGRPSNRKMALVIDEVEGENFRGRTIWRGPETTTTVVEGKLTRPEDFASLGRDAWSNQFLQDRQPWFRLRFTDTRQEGPAVELGGDYRAVLQRDRQVFGLWFNAGGLGPIGQFVLAGIAARAR